MTCQIKNNCWLAADWPAPTHIHAGTTIRGNVAEQSNKRPYGGLNLAQHVGDSTSVVNTNRKTVSAHLELKSEPIWLDQYHSSDIISIDSIPNNLKADGAYTTRKNRVCSVLTADCVPILICDESGSKVAAIHAGWKGICHGIIENAIKKISTSTSIMVWIGPCISAEFYEVGNDVYNGCISHLTLLESAFTAGRPRHWQCDLSKIVKIIFKNEGVGAIYECSLCTYKMDNLFYSYRRDGVTGRTGSLIWME